MSNMPPPPPPGNMPPPPSGMPSMGGAPTSSAGLASWGERVVSYLIDWVILVVPMIAVWIVVLVLAAIADVFGLLLIPAYLVVFAAQIYFMYLNGSVGQTPGKKVMGLKVVGEETGQVIGGGAGIGRGFLHIVDGLICYIGFLFPLWDAKRQTLADKIIKSVVTNGNPKVDFMTAVKSSIPKK